MPYKIEDREYEFDGEFTVGEAMLFFDKAKVGIAELSAELNRGNPYVVATFMYVLKKRAGEAVRWQDMESLSAASFQFVQPASAEGDPEPEGDGPDAGEAPDPTGATGTEIPETATATTS